MTIQSSVNIGGLELRPAPFVGTSYEYTRSGDYVIGGFIIVTLSGSIVGEDIVAQISELNNLQVGSNCVELIIGCQGSSDFLQGAGRVRSIDISRSDQPFISEYSITVAVETIGGRPAVPPDPEFLRQNCLDGADYILAYSEEISIEGGEQIGQSAVYNNIGFSKSYLKGKGRISITTYGREICGVPDFDGVGSAINIINQRYNSIINFATCTNSSQPLSEYGSWNKWIDTKNIEISDNGVVTCSFDVYLNNGSCMPMAWVDLTSEDKKDLITEAKTSSVNGTIKGLSSATTALIQDKTSAGERLANAQMAFAALKRAIETTSLADLGSLTGSSGDCPAPDPCVVKPKQCTQIISASVTTSLVSGEITFNFELGDIAVNCDNNTNGNSYTVETSVDETVYSRRYQEVIIPNRGNSVIQLIGDAPREVTITTRANLSGCDKSKMNLLVSCAQGQFNNAIDSYRGWLTKSYNTSRGKYSYTITQTMVKCG